MMSHGKTLVEYEVYIVVSANEYELAANMNCLDVAEDKYVTFTGYEAFKNSS